MLLSTSIFKIHKVPWPLSPFTGQPQMPISTVLLCTMDLDQNLLRVILVWLQARMFSPFGIKLTVGWMAHWKQWDSDHWISLSVKWKSLVTNFVMWNWKKNLQVVRSSASHAQAHLNDWASNGSDSSTGNVLNTCAKRKSTSGANGSETWTKLTHKREQNANSVISSIHALQCRFVVLNLEVILALEECCFLCQGPFWSSTFLSFSQWHTAQVTAEVRLSTCHWVGLMNSLLNCGNNALGVNKLRSAQMPMWVLDKRILVFIEIHRQLISHSQWQWVPWTVVAHTCNLCNVFTWSWMKWVMKCQSLVFLLTMSQMQMTAKFLHFTHFCCSIDQSFLPFVAFLFLRWCFFLCGCHISFSIHLCFICCLFPFLPICQILHTSWLHVTFDVPLFHFGWIIKTHWCRWHMQHVLSSLHCPMLDCLTALVVLVVAFLFLLFNTPHFHAGSAKPTHTNRSFSFQNDFSWSR